MVRSNWVIALRGGLGFLDFERQYVGRR